MAPLWTTVPVEAQALQPASFQTYPPQPPSLRIYPFSGPVGTVIHVSGTVDPSCIAGATPLYFESAVSGHGADYLSPPVNRGNGDFPAQIVVPSYLGGVPAGTGGTLVHPGTYEVRVVTSCGGTMAAPTLVQPFQVTSVSVAPHAFVGIAATEDGRGYWLAQADGGVRAFGDAAFYGSLPGEHIMPAAPIVGMARTPDGRGYWLVGADGGVFSFGDAAFYGSSARSFASGLGVGNTPVYAIAATPHGHGYYVAPIAASSTATNGFGSAILSAGDPQADTFLSGFALTASGQGYWWAGTDGGVFTFGDAAFYGSLPGEHIVPAAPIVGMARTPDGGGYWLVGADGGVFSFGDAGFYGSGV